MVQLYDTSSTLKIDPDVAKAYIVLLTGAGTLKKEGDNADIPLALLPQAYKEANVSEDDVVFLNENVSVSDESLAFGALTDGNVLDACFGVKDGSAGRSHASDSKSIELLQKAKGALREAQGSTDSTTNDAIQAYVRCFRIVIGYNEARKSTWFWFPFCWGYRSARGRAEKALKLAFQHLNEVIEAST